MLSVRQSTVVVCVAVLLVLGGSAGASGGAVQSGVDGDDATIAVERRGAPSATCDRTRRRVTVTVEMADATVTATDPAEVAVTAAARETLSCPTVVSISFSVPSGVAIRHSAVAAGAGLATKRLTLAPGEEQTVAVPVTGRQTGRYGLGVRVVSWPRNHTDAARERPESWLNLTVEATYVDEPLTTRRGDDSLVPRPLVVGVLLAGGLAVVVLRRWRRRD